MNEEKKKALQSLKTCKGQIEGIMKMIEDGRYCVDISNQMIAAQGLLKRANMLILKQHMNNCVRTAVKSDEHADEKIEEVMKLITKITGK